MTSQVFGIKCRQNDHAELKTQELLNMMGGIEAFISGGAIMTHINKLIWRLLKSC